MRFLWQLRIRGPAVLTVFQPPCFPLNQEGDVSPLRLSTSCDEQSFGLVQKLLLCHTVSLASGSVRITIRNRTVVGLRWHTTHGVVLEAQYQISQASYCGGIVVIIHTLLPPRAGPTLVPALP